MAAESPLAPFAPKNIYLYQVEQLHQEKHQPSPGQGHFWLDGACGEGGAQTPGWCLACVLALHYMKVGDCLLGKPGQSCPHGDTMEQDAASSTSALPSPAAGSSGCSKP